MASPPWSAADLASWARDGCILLRGFLSREEVADMVRWSSDVEAWAPPQPPLTTHTQAFERVDGALTLCRVENFTKVHGGFAGIADAASARAGALLAAEAGGEVGGPVLPGVLFKHKLNIKPPGGRGYGAHYDGPSAASVGLARTFVTVQVAIDAQTVTNGCLQVCVPRAAWPDATRAGAGDMVPPRDANPDGGGRVGAIPEDVADELPWTPIECDPGDALFFHHWLPHRSGPNRDAAPRRTLYMLFNAAGEGDHQDAYYRAMAHARREWEERAAAGGGEPAEDANEDGPAIEPWQQ